MVCLLVALVWSNAITKPPARDEQMYCTAAVLMSKGALPYRDFSYAAQLPYHPLLLATAYRLTGTSYYLLLGRLISVCCDVVVVLVLIWHYLSLGGRWGLWAGLGAASLYVLNPIVSYANGYAWNHDLVQALVLSSLVGYQRHRQGILTPAAIGLALGLAIFSRITVVLTVPAFILGFWYREHGKARYLVVLAMISGLILAAVWPVLVILRAPGAFWLELVTIPRLYGRWLSQIGMVYDKWALTISCLASPGYILTIGLLIIAGLVAGRRCINAPFLVCLGCASAFFAAAFIPPTMWIQYWAIPLPFLLAGLAWSVHAVGSAFRRNLITVAIWLGALLLLALDPQSIRSITSIWRPDQWVPIALHNQYIGLFRHAKPGGLVLTLGPLWPLEAGCSIYPELSCGSIIFRAADQLTDRQRRLARVVGPGSVHELIDRMPPDAVLVGVEDQMFAFLESTLLAAVGSQWDHSSLPAGAILWYRRSDRP